MTRIYDIHGKGAHRIADSGETLDFYHEWERSHRRKLKKKEIKIK